MSRDNLRNASEAASIFTCIEFSFFVQLFRPISLLATVLSQIRSVTSSTIRQSHERSKILLRRRCDASPGIAWLFSASPLRESKTALVFVCLCYELCSLVGWGNIPFAIFSCAQRKANYRGATWWSYNEVKDLHGLCFWPLTCKWNICLLLDLFTLLKFSPCKDLKQCKYCVPLGCGGQPI